MHYKFILFIIGFLLILQSCEEPRTRVISSINPVNWKKRMVTSPLSDSLISGRTYLSVYSQIYNQSEQRTLNLTATISMRNVSDLDTIIIRKAEYFNTQGNSIRNYFNKPIFLAPMETVEIIIDQVDQEGGTGGNFIFDWSIQEESIEPLFEGVMISAYEKLGLSFTTQGKRIQ